MRAPVPLGKASAQHRCHAGMRRRTPHRARRMPADGLHSIAWGI